MPKLTHGPLVGATTHHSVMIWLRADDDCHSEIRVAKEHNDLPEKYIARGSTILKETKDFTGVIEFTGLEPDTHYSYCVFLDGELALSNSLFPSPSFQTFPLPNQHAPDFSFAFGSCFIPQRYQDKIFNQIAERSSTQKNSVSNLRFFIMLGDNVYVDEYVKDICEKKKIDCPSVAEYYKGAYRDTWKYKNFRRALSQLSTYMIFDDHEFWDNWGNIDPNDPPSKHYDAEHDEHAKQTYQIYQDSHNPDYQSRHTNNKNQYFYKFGYGNVGFFVLDCRTERKADEKIMLGVEQWHALFEWLLDTKDNYAVKFIVSSVPITFIGLPHWLINKFHEKLGDQWLGYTKERLRLFEFIQKNKIQGVHFLSGDIHLGQAIVIRSKLENEAPPVYAYTSSPLAQTFWLLPETAPAWLDKTVYSLARRFVQLLHGLSLRFVANDDIKAEGIHYEPKNLFPVVKGNNFGVVHIRQKKQGIEIQYEIYDEDGRCVAGDKPHFVN